MKKTYYILFILFLALLFVDKANAQTLTGDASSDTKHITFTKIDSTGGLQKPGGIDKIGGLSINLSLDLGGLPINVSKTALDKYRGPDLLNPCAFLGSSFIKPEGSVNCHYLITAVSTTTQCAAGEIFSENANKCVKDCPLGQEDDGNGVCKTFCPPDQHEVSAGVCACNDATMVLDAVRGCVKATTVCPGNKIDDDDDPATPCVCAPGTEEKANNMCCGTDCNLINNECVTACPAGQFDLTNSCDKNQCQSNCDQGSTWNSGSNRCECNGDFTEVPPGSEACDCPFPAIYDTNSTPENPVCECPVDQEYNSTAKECRCSGNTIPDRNVNNPGVCRTCPSNATADNVYTCTCNDPQAYYDYNLNTCTQCPSNASSVGEACVCQSPLAWDASINACQ